MSKWDYLYEEAMKDVAAEEERLLFEVIDGCDDCLAVLPEGGLLRRRAVVCNVACNSGVGLVSVNECLQCHRTNQ